MYYLIGISVTLLATGLVERVISLLLVYFQVSSSKLGNRHKTD